MLVPKRDRPKREEAQDSESRARRARASQTGLSASQRRQAQRDIAPGAKRSEGDAIVIPEPTRSNDDLLIVSGVTRASMRVLELVHSTIEFVDLRDGNGLPRSNQFAIGDRVALEKDDKGLITAIRRAERSTSLVRFRDDPSHRAKGQEHVLAANVDVAVIVMSATNLKQRLIDRFLILAEYGDIEPILCVNKIDQWRDGGEDRRLIETALAPYESLATNTVYVSAVRGDNLQVLHDAVQGKTSVFTGQSGVGKSSLVNALFGQELQTVGEVRASDERGRHTTSASSIVSLGEGTYLIDTPGIRQLESLMRDDPLLLRNYFPEMQKFQDDCRFTDCLHIPEPACAVKQIVIEDRNSTEPRISFARYDSYIRLADPDGALRAEMKQRVKHGDLLASEVPWMS